MTAIFNITLPVSGPRAPRWLLVGASALALAAPLSANELLFTTSDARPETGQRIDQRAGLTQVALTGGGTVSIVDAAEYRLNADGSVDLYEGTITVASGAGREVVVRMPEGLEGRVAGAGAAGNFTAREGGEASGHALSGAVQIGRAGALERFAAGEMWRARGAGDVRRVIANAAQVQPTLASDQPAVIAIGDEAGPVAAARNGIPVSFGDQLAGAGASGDIVLAARRIEAAVGNPSLDVFPSGDLALLVAAAARLEGSFGGTPFPAAQADIITAYLRFLAGGGAGSEFVSAYSRFVVNYLDLIRAGGLPSGFAATRPADIDAYLGYIRRTGAITTLAARDRVLADAYLSFLASGGNRDGFAGSFTNLTTAYFAFVRGGGDPAAFAGASQAALAQTIAFLRDSGLVAQLATPDRALVEAFLANGGLAFASQYRAALGDYFAFLASGRRPSEYTALDQATVRAYLETLANTGLLASVLGERAGFYADYLAFLRSGGAVDGFAGLPANIFAGYASQLDGYFAFLASGRRPSEFTGTDIATLNAWIAQLQAAGALERFLGQRSQFFAEYAAFVAGGGNVDAFAGLPVNIFTGYARDLRAFFDFLAAGGVPSAYTLLTPETVRAYLAALEAAGATASFLGDLGSFYRDYAAFLASGGNPDLFAGLPVAPDFAALASALNAYAAFLQGGGLPSGYTAQDLASLRIFLDALARSGCQAELLGANADLLTRYFAFVAGGGAVDGFAGLPVYADYVAALNAYFAFLQGGGLPSAYTALDAATIQAYLAALARAEGGLTGFAALNRFFVDYFAFVAGGGNPDRFAGLPGNSTPPDTGTPVTPVPGTPTMLAGYTGGFDPASANINIIIAGNNASGAFVGSETGFTASPFLLNADGGLQSYTRQGGGQVRNRGNTTVRDIFGNANAVIGRWTNGTISIPNTFTFNDNQGLHYMLTRPAPANILNTLRGRVDYYLIAATSPTIGNGSLAPGRFEAGMAIALGGEYRLAMEGSITMPRAGTPYVFSFATAGGLADPSRSQTILGANTSSFVFASIPGTDNAGNCGSNPELCVFNMRGAFAGDLDTIGITYEAAVGTRANWIVGAAIFAAGPNRTFGTGGNGAGTGGTTPPPPAPIAANGVVPTDTAGRYLAYISASGTQLGTVGSVTITDGKYVSNSEQSGSIKLNYLANASTVTETGGDQGVIGWQRDENVLAEYRNRNNQNAVAQQRVNQSWHTIWGSPVTNLPTTGLVNFSLIGATKATQTNGEGGFGTFAGSLAVNFATMRVGIDATVDFGGTRYAFATNGGVGNPTLGLDNLFGGRRFDATLATTANGSVLTGGTAVQGFLAGNGASHAGMTYAIRAAAGNEIQGAAAFASPRPAVASASFAAPPTAALVGGIDMSRWGGPASAAPQGSAVTPQAGDGFALLPPTMEAAEAPAAATALSREAAIRQADIMLGGLVTFPGAALSDR